MGINEGDKAPSFMAKTHVGETIKLSDFSGKKVVVLFFYPKDDTPVCTKEACSFRDAYEDFTAAGAEVIGISQGSEEQHQAFASKHRLPFPLLIDEGNNLRKAFGVPKSLGLLPGRVTYVIDKEGVVKKRFSSQFGSHQHMEEALTCVKDLVNSSGE